MKTSNPNLIGRRRVLRCMVLTSDGITMGAGKHAGLAAQEATPVAATVVAAPEIDDEAIFKFVLNLE